MKKIIAISFMLVWLYSCNDELKNFGNNPNNTTNSSPDLLLTATEVSTFANESGGVLRSTNIFTQHLTGTTDGQFNKIGKYDIKEATYTNEWIALYHDAMENAHLIMETYGDNNPYYDGMAKVLMAMNLSYATDLWGKVPYDNAFQGLKLVFRAKYDSQQQIYSTLQRLLSEAIVDFDKKQSDNQQLPAGDDLIFNGAVKKWKKIAYVLKARYALRLTQVNETSAAQDALKYIKSSQIVSDKDDMQAIFDGKTNSTNQWAAFQSTRANYIKMGKTFMDMMISTNDPRLPFFATKDKNKGYSGSSADDDTNSDVSDIGPALASADRNIGMVTYVEAKFIEAEAKFRTGDKTGAQTDFTEAVRASVEKVTGGAADMTFVNKVAKPLTLENIIKQKYIALFGSLEPYNDFRRTGFPKLTPNSKGNSDKDGKIKIPLRFPTVKSERLYNSDAEVEANIYKPVWWDK